MTDELKEAVDRLKAMDSVVIEQFDPDNAIWCDIRLVLTALQSANERADRAEAVLRKYADVGNWSIGRHGTQVYDDGESVYGYDVAQNALEGEV